MKIDKRTANYKEGFRKGLWEEKNKRKIRITEIRNVKVFKSITVFVKNKGWVNFNLDIHLIGDLRIYNIIRPVKREKNT